MSGINMARIKRLKVVEIAEYILDTKCTVREAANKFNVGKTTIHRYMVNDLPKYSIVLARKVRSILDYNKLSRHIRGGNATKLKFENLRNKKQ